MSALAIGLFLKRGLSTIVDTLGKLNIWQLGCLALAALALVQHFIIADARHDRDSYKAQRDYYRAEIDKADKAARDAQAVIAKLTQDIRNRTDEENRRIAGDADALRVSGPGKAACRPAPAASGEHEPGRGNGNAPGPQVPPDDSAAVSWGWLTDRAEEHDLNRAEVLAWREWYRKLVESWPK
jgi:hypothetical protein